MQNLSVQQEVRPHAPTSRPIPAFSRPWEDVRRMAEETSDEFEYPSQQCHVCCGWAAVFPSFLHGPLREEPVAKPPIQPCVVESEMALAKPPHPAIFVPPSMTFPQHVNEPRSPARPGVDNESTNELELLQALEALVPKVSPPHETRISNGVPVIFMGVPHGFFPRWLLASLARFVMVWCLTLLNFAFFTMVFPATHQEDVVGEAARMRHLPPFYLVHVFRFSTCLLTAVIFGPPWKQGRMIVSFRAREVATVAFLSLFILGALRDCNAVAEICGNMELGLWQRLCVVVAVLGSSANVSKFAANMALIGIYAAQKMWQEQRGYSDCLSIAATIRRDNGRLFEAYIAMSATYTLATVLLLIFCLPAAVAYFYFAIALVLVCYLGASALGPLVPILSRSQRLELHPPEAAIGQHPRQQQQSGDSGTPLAWEDFFLAALLCGVLPSLLAPCGARLLSGMSYLDALSSTLSERSLSSVVPETWAQLLDLCCHLL
mmetsp:Transcript_26390/g.51725  ORF Transcript_26390/g.51725 Transcript_26390/m.51725 type:complete len:490 (+) Transcript_26390:116-1585(+)